MFFFGGGGGGSRARVQDPPINNVARHFLATQEHCGSFFFKRDCWDNVRSGALDPTEELRECPCGGLTPPCLGNLFFPGCLRFIYTYIASLTGFHKIQQRMFQSGDNLSYNSKCEFIIFVSNEAHNNQMT